MMVSVVIPCYNVERFLGTCLESVVRAARKFGSRDGEASTRVEIVLVENGSEDGTMGVIQRWAEKLKGELAVRVVECQTPGAAAARNLGAREAKGKYLWFVDADDRVAESSMEELVCEAEETGADLVMMGAQRVFPDGRRNYLSAVRPEEANFRSRFVRYGAGPWQFLIRREWWVENGFSFREGIIHEDMEMISSLILYTERFAAVDRALYFYYQNAGSVLHKQRWDPHYLDIFEALSGLYGRFEKARAVSEFREELEWFFIWNLLIDSAKDFGKFPEGRVGFSRAREMLREYFPGWRKNRFLSEKPLKLRLRVFANYARRR